MLASSTEYVHIPITGPDAGTLTPTDIEVGVSAARNVAPTQWWPADGITDGVARVLVGPGNARPLTPGAAHFRVRITATTETPVLYAGTLPVTT